jgi:hypothetical protein
MGFDLSSWDHKRLDLFLDVLFDAVADGRITSAAAKATLAHVITAAAIGNEGEFKSWLARTAEEILNA